MQIAELDLAELFHENTKLTPFENGLSPRDLPEEIDPNLASRRFRLSRVNPTSRALELSILSRVTCRSFNRTAPMPEKALSRLLAYSCGITAATHEWDPSFEHHRASPSAGATYPIEVFPVILRVAGLPPGAYRYFHDDHSILQLRAGRFGRALSAWTMYQPYVADVGVVFVLAGFLDRVRSTYGERGYRYMLLEAGHIAQNLSLLSAAHGLGCLCVGGFVEAAISRLLGLNDISEIPLYLVGVGAPR